MHYKLTLPRPWRYRDRARGMQVLPAGDYDVPEQVSQRVADLAVAQGMATMEMVPESIGIYTPRPKPQRRPKQGPKRRKGPAPENKLSHVAENKQTLV